MGTIFKVSDDILRKMDFFASALDRWSVNDTICVDRCPKSFELVLIYLIYDIVPEFIGNVSANRISNTTTKFLLDCTYYGVHGVADKYLGYLQHNGSWRILYEVAIVDTDSNPLWSNQVLRCCDNEGLLEKFGKGATVKDFMLFSISNETREIKPYLESLGVNFNPLVVRRQLPLAMMRR